MDYAFTPFCCFILCFSNYYHILEWILLIYSLFWSFNLLPLSICSCPLLHNSSLVSLDSARSIFTALYSWPTIPPPPPIVNFGSIYLLIIYCTFFPFSFSTFPHVTSLVAWWSELLTTNHEVSGSIPGSTMCVFSWKGKTPMVTMRPWSPWASSPFKEKCT